MYIYISIYIYIVNTNNARSAAKPHVLLSGDNSNSVFLLVPASEAADDWRYAVQDGKRDSIHHHLLEAVSESANVPELRQKLLYTTPSGLWWCINSVFRQELANLGADVGSPAISMYSLEIQRCVFETQCVVCTCSR